MKHKIPGNDLDVKLQNRHLKKAVVYIKSHYHENITLEALSKSASLNHTSLTELFKKELGITPIRFLWQYRITVAKRHLELTDLNIKEISTICGFKTVQHFSRKFESCTGSTPTAFRNACRHLKQIPTFF